MYVVPNKGLILSKKLGETKMLIKNIKIRYTISEITKCKNTIYYVRLQNVQIQYT